MTQSYKNQCQGEAVPRTLTSHLCAGSSVDLDLEALIDAPCSQMYELRVGK